MLPLFVSLAHAATWVVDDTGPADFTSVQDALDTAASGDTIYVRDGTYYEGWIDGDAFDGAVLSVPPGVTLVGESVEGVVVYSDFPSAPVRTSSVYFQEGSHATLVAQMTIVNTTPGTEDMWWGQEVAYSAVTECCGYELGDGEAEIRRVVLSLPESHPKVLLYASWSDLLVRITNVTADFDPYAGDVTYLNHLDPISEVRNSILNQTTGTGRYWGTRTTDPQVTTAYTDLYQGGAWGTGDIDADPLFASGGSYVLSAASPAVDAGDPDPAYNDDDGTRNDMGALGGPSVFFPADADDDYYSDDGILGGTVDCDDSDATVYPGAPETCDGVDDDCDGMVDEDPTDPSTFYADVDGDGYGDAAATAVACTAPAGFVADATDCDDGAAVVNPGVAEICDERDLDEDCDGTADDLDPSVDPASATDWYLDADGDAYGGALTHACERPDGHVAAGGDCDDADPAVHPRAEEPCGTTADLNCDGSVDDDDADTDGTMACLDCDDADPAIHPDADETVGDETDQDCDGWEDCFVDGDGDGFRPEGDARVASDDADCADAGEAPASAGSGDCDDADPTIHPGADDTPGDGLDQDCTDGDASTPEDSGSTDSGEEARPDEDPPATAACGCASGAAFAPPWVLVLALVVVGRRGRERR